VAAAERTYADEATIARLMALAEADLQLRQAELGLIGSTLGSTREAVVADARPSEVAHVRVVAKPAPAASAPNPARKAAPASAPASER